MSVSLSTAQTFSHRLLYSSEEKDRKVNLATTLVAPSAIMRTWSGRMPLALWLLAVVLLSTDLATGTKDSAGGKSGDKGENSAGGKSGKSKGEISAGGKSGNSKGENSSGGKS